MRFSDKQLLTLITAVACIICIIMGVRFIYSRRKITVSYRPTGFKLSTPKTYYAPEQITPQQEQQQFATNSIGTARATQTTQLSTAEYQEQVHMEHISTPNTKLFQIADQYFQVYYNGKRVSPLFPLALANVETPGRADHNITWSALFPSKVVNFDLVDSFDVTYVAQDPSKYDALMHEWSTRDRGALQMSPTYGTSNPFFTNQMTGTEQAKLAGVTIAPAAQAWSHGAASQPGDRFNTHDVCLRLASADSTAIQHLYAHQLSAESDPHLIVLLAMFHHRSGVWQADGAGGWRSRALAYEYSKQVCNSDIMNRLLLYHSEYPDIFTMDKSTALQFFPNWSTYTTSSLEASYPIRVLYAYQVLLEKYQ